MRGLGALLAAVIALQGPGLASAERLPPGSIGAIAGIASGTGADARRLGFGYQVGGQAAWQPMSTDRRLGWALRWSVAFGTMYEADAAAVGDVLKTLHMDLAPGVRIRPGVNPSRYMTLRGGVQLLRASQQLPPTQVRTFWGAVASVGIDQYAYGFLFHLDVRVNQIGEGPTIIALMFGAGKSGP
jgi:hypothetical protein